MKGERDKLILTDGEGNDIVVTRALFEATSGHESKKRSTTKPPSIRRTLFRLAQAGDEQVAKWLWDNYSLRVMRQEEIDALNNEEKLREEAK